MLKYQIIKKDRECHTESTDSSSAISKILRVGMVWRFLSLWKLQFLILGL